MPKTAEAYNLYGWKFDHNTITCFADPNTVPAWLDQSINNAAWDWTTVRSNMY